MVQERLGVVGIASSDVTGRAYHIDSENRYDVAFRSKGAAAHHRLVPYTLTGSTRRYHNQPILRHPAAEYVPMCPASGAMGQRTFAYRASPSREGLVRLSPR